MKEIKSTIYHLLIFTTLIAGCRKESVFVDRRLPETTIGAGDPRLTAKEIHFSKDTAYLLATDLGRDSGQTLTIEAGTLIKAMDKVSIYINPGATIEAKGTPDAPIVFTSSAPTGSAGVAVIGASYGSDHFWYGIRIYGHASDSTGPGSGTLSYVRIEFGGGDANFAGWPSLLLQHVNKQTTLENIQVSYSYANNSFEFYGGNCNARNLLSYASGGSDFYIHQGYKGMLQGLLAYRHPYFPVDQKDFAGLYISDAGTVPVISNLTVLGPDLQRGTSAGYLQSPDPNAKAAGLVTTGETKFHIRNAALLGFPRQGWYLDNTATATSIADGGSDLTYSLIHCNDSSKAFFLKAGTYGSATSADFRDYMLGVPFANQQLLSSDQFVLTDPFNYNVHPDPTPKDGSPLLSGANFDGPFNDAFFNKVNYRGAVGADNWMKNWTNFIPLQTNYNN